MSQLQILRRLAEEMAWRAGRLEHLLHADQRRVRESMRVSRSRRFVMEIARKWGKTWLLCVLACEACLREKGVRVVYGGPSLKHLEEFVQPIMRALSDLAPVDCRPTWHDADGHWRFPNGSWVHLFAADDLLKARRGRGPAAVLAIFDEAGFSPVLQYVLDDVFRPSLMLTNGLTVLGSTPSDVPEHPFTAIAELEEAEGNYAHRTLYDNPMMTAAQVEEFLAENARQRGLTIEQYRETDTYRREYLAERFVDKNLLAIPEWAAWREESFRIARETRRPKLFRGQVALDFGGHDPHAGIFGYWHPLAAHGQGAAVIERDLLLRAQETTRQLDAEVKRVEREAWGVTLWDGTLAALTRERLEAHFGEHVPAWLVEKVGEAAQPQPYQRVSDTQMELVRHLFASGVACIPTPKDHKQHHVMLLRDAIRARELVIGEQCVDVDRHLRTTTWRDVRRKDWARRADEHGDLVDCLLYFWRCLERDLPVEEIPRALRRDSESALERRLSASPSSRWH